MSYLPLPTSTTDTRASRVDVGVGRVVAVSPRAVCFRSLLRSASLASKASLAVHAVRDGLKMFWVRADTCWRAAYMVQIVPGRDRSMSQLIRESMREHELRAIPEVAIPEGAVGGGPNPTTGSLRHLLPETVFRRAGWPGESSSGSVMQHAVIVTGGA